MKKLSALTVVFALGCSSAVSASNDAGSDIPAVDTPAVDTPGVDTPAVDTPAVDRTVVDAPLLDTPVTDRPPTTRVPMRHRATTEVCPTVRPAGGCMIGGSGPPSACMLDTECTTGTNGRCVGNPHDGCRCSYDQCQGDDGCTTGGPCACRLATRGGAGANVCLGGNCRTDSNCGAGGYCSPTLGGCGDYGGVTGFYCHTPADECIDDADCLSTTDAGFLGQVPYCAYNRETSRWQCSNNACAG